MSLSSMDFPKDIVWPSMPFSVEGHAICVVRRGSESHGLYIPPTEPEATDDRDIFAVVVASPNYYLGLDHFDQAEAINGCWDVLIYDIRKFMQLLEKQNPNVLCALWCREEDILYQTVAWQRLRQARQHLMNPWAFRRACCGYAHGQLMRATHLQREGYMGEKRRCLAEKYGYDTKNAAHCIRLLHMYEEFMTTGALNVYRTHDRQQLLDIKQGKWSIEDVQREANACMKRIDAAEMPLRLELHEDLSMLCMTCIHSTWEWDGDFADACDERMADRNGHV